MAIELCELIRRRGRRRGRRRRKRRKKNMDIIGQKVENVIFGTQITLDMFCAVKSLIVKLT